MRLSDRIANALALDTFDRRHKVGLGLLVVAMITIVIIWYVQLRQNIITPLYGNNTSNQNTAVLSQEQQTQSDLRSKDTDGDGLNDWDELNLYKTSPYLADTDSDSFSDKQEIESGNDPTCPEGQSCVVSTTPSSTNSDSSFESSTLENLLNQNSSGTQTQTNTNASSTSTTNTSLSAEEKNALREALGENAQPADLRKLLLQAGMEQKTLDSLTDEQIVTTFQEMIK